jgi:hypothetical protein
MRHIFRLHHQYVMIRKHSSSIRRDLSPLIKLIHPDHFGQQEEKIKKENLSFLQSLNELADLIQKLVNGSRALQSIDITHPLAKSYRLSFYVPQQPSIDTNPPTEDASATPSHHTPNLRLIKLALFTPPELTLRHRLSKVEVDLLISKLLLQMSQMFISSGLPNPWQEGNKKKDENEPNTNEVHDSRFDPYVPHPSPGSSTKTQKQWAEAENFARRKLKDDMTKLRAVVQRQIADKVMEREATFRWNNPQLECPTLDTLFPNHTYADTYTSKQIDKAMEVLRFVTNGHVMVRNSPGPKEEVIAMDKFRQFLIDFGKSINFSLWGWSRVLFLLDGQGKQPPLQFGGRATNMAGHQFKPPNEYLYEVIGGAKSDSKAMSEKVNQPSQHQPDEDGHMLVTIPMKFKAKKLVHHLVDNLPVAHFAYVRTSSSIADEFE